MILSSSSVRLRSSSCLKMLSVLQERLQPSVCAGQSAGQCPNVGQVGRDPTHFLLSIALSADAKSCARLLDCSGCSWSITTASESINSSHVPLPLNQRCFTPAAAVPGLRATGAYGSGGTVSAGPSAALTLLSRSLQPQRLTLQIKCSSTTAAATRHEQGAGDVM